MGYIPVSVERFGGLNLMADPTDLGLSGATACSNVAFDVPGRFRTRDGYAELASPTTAPTRVHIYSTAAFFHYITSSTTKLEAFDSTGTAVASGTVASTGPHSMVTYGTASASVVYTVSQQDASLRKWSGTAWSTVAAGPVNGVAVTVDTDSNRLVVAGHNGGDRVQWSDAGAPDTWTSTSWVDLTPGDGESILNICCWQGLLFVFKRTKFFVFTGESTASGGTPVFNYRTVNGIGAFDGLGSVAVAPHGVYFIAPDGIYLTTGGAPVLVSQAIQTLFGVQGSSPLRLSTNNHLLWHREKLIVTLADINGVATVYVWWRPTDAWAQWTLMDTKLGGGFASESRANTIAFVDGTSLKLYQFGPTRTTDNGAGIAWSYTTGYSDVGGYFRGAQIKAAERKRLRMTDILGTGTITHQVLTLNSRPNDVADPGGSVTLGVSPAVARGNRRRSSRGTFFAHKLSGTGAASVSKLTHWIAGVGGDT